MARNQPDLNDPRLSPLAKRFGAVRPFAAFN